jgi:dihydrofolate reductase
MSNIEMEMIVAVAQNNVIGDTTTNQLLWHLPEDLSRFYRLTKGQVVIMGRKTFDSLPLGKLPHRINIVLTHSPHPQPLELMTQQQNEPTNTPIYFVTFSMLWELLSHIVEKKIFVIGGSSIYKLLFPFCSVIHYTLADIAPVGNVSFPFSREELTNASSLVEYEPASAAAEDNWNTSTHTESLRYKYITYHLK